MDTIWFVFFYLEIDGIMKFVLLLLLISGSVFLFAHFVGELVGGFMERISFWFVCFVVFWVLAYAAGWRVYNIAMKDLGALFRYNKLYCQTEKSMINLKAGGEAGNLISLYVDLVDSVVGCMLEKGSKGKDVKGILNDELSLLGVKTKSRLHRKIEFSAKKEVFKYVGNRKDEVMASILWFAFPVGGVCFFWAYRMWRSGRGEGGEEPEIAARVVSIDEQASEDGEIAAKIGVPKKAKEGEAKLKGMTWV